MAKTSKAGLGQKAICVVIAVIVAATMSLVIQAGAQDRAFAVQPKPKIALTSSKKVRLQTGETHQIMVKATNGAKLKFKSSKKSVATVSGKGLVKAKKRGKATITIRAKKGNKTTKKRIKVVVSKVKKSGKNKATQDWGNASSSGQGGSGSDGVNDVGGGGNSGSGGVIGNDDGSVTGNGSNDNGSSDTGDNSSDANVDGGNSDINNGSDVDDESNSNGDSSGITGNGGVVENESSNNDDGSSNTSDNSNDARSDDGNSNGSGVNDDSNNGNDNSSSGSDNSDVAEEDDDDNNNLTLPGTSIETNGDKNEDGLDSADSNESGDSGAPENPDKDDAGSNDSSNEGNPGADDPVGQDNLDEPGVPEDSGSLVDSSNSSEGGYSNNPSDTGNADGTGDQGAQEVLTETYLNVSEGSYRFACELGGKIVDVPSGKPDNNLGLFTWKDNGQTTQRFFVERVNGDVYTIQACCSGKYLADNNGTFAQQSKSSSVAQQWRFVKSGSNVMLKNVATDRYVTVASTADKAPLTLQKASNAANQRFVMASMPIITDGCYVLVSFLGTLRLDVSGASKANDANVQLWSNNGLNAQKWYIKYYSAGYYTITCSATNKALAVQNYGVVDGSNVVQHGPLSHASQRWTVKPSSNGGLVFTNKNSGMVLTVANNKNEAGANVMQSANTDALGQRWSIVPTQKIEEGVKRTYNVGVEVKEVADYNGVTSIVIPDGTYRMQSDARYLNMDWASLVPGGNAQICSSTTSNAQFWIFRHRGNGYYTISCACSGLRLDAENGGYQDGANVRQWVHNTSDAQLWHAEYVNGSLVFINKAGGRALDIQGNGYADGTNVQVWPRNDGAPQCWRLSKAVYTSGTKSVKVGDFSVTQRTNDDGYVTVEIPNGTYCLESNLGRLLDVDGGSMNAGANVQLWDLTYSDAQHFTFNALGGGVYTITCKRSGLRLDVQDGLAQNGANVRQWTANDGDAERWIARIVDNSLVFVNKANGLALDVDGCRSYNGVNVQTWGRNNAQGQFWKLRALKEQPIEMQCEQVSRDIFDAYNNYRASFGLNRVAWSEGCKEMAMGSAKGCADRGRLVHRLGIPVNLQHRYSDILQDATWKLSGVEAVSKWANSTGHRRQMKCPTATCAGVATYFRDGCYYYVIVYDFVDANQMLDG